MSFEINENDRKVALSMQFDMKGIFGALEELAGWCSQNDTFQARIQAIQEDGNWGDSHGAHQKRLFLAGSVWINIFLSDTTTADKKRMLRLLEQFIDQRSREYPLPNDLKRLIGRYRSGHGDMPLSDRSPRQASRKESPSDAPPGT